LGVLRAQCVAPQLKSPDDKRLSYTIPIVSMAAKKEAILAVEREPLVGLRSGLRQVQQ
jgi:hypothetical protein